MDISRQFSLPEESIRRIIRTLPKTSRRIFYALVATAFFSAFGLFWQMNNALMVTIPAHGGSLTEGIVGTPRFINPVLAISDADRDIASLVYSGLLRTTSSGDLVPDLAESYSISEDGLVYTFTMRDDAVFHDGTPVTSDDVIFTVRKAQDTTLKSPKRASWEGIIAEAVDRQTVRFTLKQPYAIFLENTTLGILPRHLWEQIPPEQFGFSELNIRAIGSGPYRITAIKRDKSGIPTYYDFESFRRFAGGEPYIKDIRIRFYPNESALLRAYAEKKIESMHAISPTTASALGQSGNIIATTALPRVFGVFFNQNQAPVFTDTSVRQALNLALNREDIIDEVLSGYGTPLFGPIPPGAVGYMANSENTADASNINAARELIEKNGWTKNEETGIYEKKTNKGTLTLSFALATSDAEELKHAAELIRDTWNKVGADVTLQIFDIGELNQNIIRPRKYDALFFGEIIGRDSDPFAFWHSSQRLDPGLNIALYANITTDKLLEEARVLSGKDARAEKYAAFQMEIRNDTPAVFVYAPDFIYVIPEKIAGFALGPITIPSERFASVTEWYIRTDRVWEIFAP
ncbi:MAG: hypothetical protein COW88_02415 [Candidatus Lloydbacteria bacterium CG22_combo_CG10-13_8_21_14_all_47_15]|uniref:Solute-binding protein family 5 domain-containing protein n=1 Tax=Candidatus Lloydbacteria bacterium CG22_combo_CG10-13_8_21_14_all_47_15 TaxID=1974635 RepID=A0A2H0CTP3_9BACT|nr:MAG: hypothetical protein COW88_02415 [Candidatus Lloydbacteria bacterium CG22_combo_CG10-13_8_21_14_all_47_15]